MKFTAIGRTLGDETTPYSVTEYKSKTVAEFVNEVLEIKNNWGEIKVKGLGSIEYRYSKLLDEIPAEWYYYEIEKIEACGGWSRMDYVVMINNINMTDKQKNDFVESKFIKCIRSFSVFEAGKTYWLEYIGNDTYYGRSDNILNRELVITPEHLLNNFTSQ